ncbi:MAG: sel1 repeat family protein [Deltaproteobacteria bacterium]|nr:sel1 repeat family protein [Deltaproteobacteria bacterium]
MKLTFFIVVPALLVLAVGEAHAIDRKCPAGQVWSISQGSCVKRPPPPKPASPQEKHDQAVDHLEGRGKAPDAKKGVALLEEACSAKHGESCTLLGFLYSRGRAPVARDEKKGMDYYVRACDLKDLEGCFNVGDLAYRTGDYARARSGFKFACELGSGVGCARGADLLESGVGGPTDAAAAAPMFKRSFDILDKLCPGDGNACFVVGWLNERGKGTAKNPKRALDSYRSGCRAGSGTSCMNLANALDDGSLGAKDVDGANEAYDKACLTYDNAAACQKLGERLGMAKKDLPHALELAKRGCELDPSYCGTLAEFYRLGFGIPAPDQALATRYYKQSCESGESGWCGKYAERAHDGVGTPKDVKGAMAALERACQAGYGESCRRGAQYLVDDGGDATRAATMASLGCDHKNGGACWLAGRMAATGRGVTKSDEKAYGFYDRGCGMNWPSACEATGAALRTGTGVAKDLEKAFARFDAACKGNETKMSSLACKSWGEMALAGDGTTVDPKIGYAGFARACEYGEADTCPYLPSLMGPGGAKREDMLKTYDVSCKREEYEPACLAWGNYLSAGTSSADHRAAYELFAAACARKSEDGCLRQADLLSDGFGVTKDAEKAAALYRTRCDANRPGACFGLARLEEKANRAEDAMRLYTRACDGGFADGCNVVGYKYYTAQGVRWDVTQAATYFMKSCELGSLSGCANSGEVFRYGAGQPQDHKKAFAYYEKSCRPTDASGCGGLGFYLASGTGGVKVDRVRAETALRQACLNDAYVVAEACRDLANLLEQKGSGGAAEIARLRTTAFTRAQELAKDNPYYMYILGTYHADGMATVKDPAKALELLTRSCDGFDPLGCIAAGKVLSASTKGDDRERAKVYFERACAAGIDDGCTLGKSRPAGPKPVSKAGGCCGGEVAPGGGAALTALVLGFALRRRRPRR